MTASAPSHRFTSSEQTLFSIPRPDPSFAPRSAIPFLFGPRRSHLNDNLFGFCMCAFVDGMTRLYWLGGVDGEVDDESGALSQVR